MCIVNGQKTAFAFSIVIYILLLLSWSVAGSITVEHKDNDIATTQEPSQTDVITDPREYDHSQLPRETDSNESTSSYCLLEQQPRFKFGNGSLLTYMLRLQLCQVIANRTWFIKECEKQTYAINDYYKAVYMKFCNPKNFQQKCKGTTHYHSDIIIKEWITNNSFKSIENYKSLKSNYSFSGSDLAAVKPLDCDAISSFFVSLADKDGYFFENRAFELDFPFYGAPYTEWLLLYRPFCQDFACGVSKQNHENYSLSCYECADSNCKAALVITIFVDLTLAVIIVVANSLVLGVAFRTKLMKNVPGYFKISLAIADLLVGLVVLPGGVYNNIQQSFKPLPFRAEGQSPQITDYVDQQYLNFMGVITICSFGVSIYTMGVGSIDRYLAVTKPFEYKQGKYITKKRSLITFVAVWIFCFIIAIYPVFTNEAYNISALGLVLSTGIVGTVVYAITLALPLFAVWGINIAMLIHVCSEKKQRRSLSMVRKKKTTKTKAKHNGRSSSAIRPSEPLQGDEFANDNSASKNNNSANEIKRLTDSTREFNPESRQKSRLAKLTSAMHSKIKRRFSRSQDSPSNQANIERQLAKTLAVMVGAFTIAILPCIFILAILPAVDSLTEPRLYPSSYSAEVMNTFTSLQYIASRLFLSNSFWNCIIYSVRNKHFRRSIAEVFICDEAKLRQKRSTIANSHSSSRSGGQVASKHTTSELV